MTSSYALTGKTLVALGLAARNGAFTRPGAWDAPSGVYGHELHALTPVDAYRVLRRLVELLTGEPLGDDAQVYVADTLGVWSWFWWTGGGTESGDLPNTEHARDWLHAVGLAAVAVANDIHFEAWEGNPDDWRAHRLYVNNGDGWEVADD